jgi:hypothetical protein
MLNKVRRIRKLEKKVHDNKTPSILKFRYKSKLDKLKKDFIIIEDISMPVVSKDSLVKGTFYENKRLDGRVFVYGEGEHQLITHGDYFEKPQKVYIRYTPIFLALILVCVIVVPIWIFTQNPFFEKVMKISLCLMSSTAVLIGIWNLYSSHTRYVFKSKGLLSLGIVTLLFNVYNVIGWIFPSIQLGKVIASIFGS